MFTDEVGCPTHGSLIFKDFTGMLFMRGAYIKEDLFHASVPREYEFLNPACAVLFSPLLATPKRNFVRLIIFAFFGFALLSLSQ